MNITTIRFLIIIPCFNEEEAISLLIKSIKENTKLNGFNFEILIVNDCSTDNTLKIIKTLSCKYLDLPVNLGIGGAMQAGYKYAFKNNFDFAIQVDGDGQHPANELPKLFTEANKNEADVIIGSRFLEKKGFQSSVLRRFGINYFSLLNRILIGQTIKDSTSGFRVFNRKTIKIVNSYYPDDYPEPESIVLFGLKKLKIKEVPVVMNERQGGVSSIRSFNAIFYMLKVTLGIFFAFIRFKGKWKM